MIKLLYMHDLAIKYIHTFMHNILTNADATLKAVGFCCKTAKQLVVSFALQVVSLASTDRYSKSC